MLTLVYPVDGYETPEHRTFLMGSVAAGEGLSINGVPRSLGEHGFFCITVDLALGSNVFRLKSTSGREKTISIVRQGSQASTELQKGVQWLSPQGPLTLYAGSHYQDEGFLVEAIVPDQNQVVSVWVAGITPEPLPLQAVVNFLSTESTSPQVDSQSLIDDRVNLFGELHWVKPPTPLSDYRYAWISLPQEIQQGGRKHIPIEYWVHHKIDGKTDVGTMAPSSLKTSGAHLSVLTSPRWAKVIVDEAICRVAPSVHGARLTPQPKGTVLKIMGEQSGFLAVELGQSGDSGYRRGWVPQVQTQWIDAPALRETAIRLMKTERISPGETALKIKLPQHGAGYPPVQIEVVDLQTLKLHLSQSVCYCDVIPYDPQDELIRSVSWYQRGSSDLTVTLSLNHPLSGYTINTHADEWSLLVRSLALKLKDQPLTQTRVLLDPGHGGDELGSVAPDGVAEKVYNLSWAAKVQEAFSAKGFKHVLMTRNLDKAVSLAERCEAANTYNADVVISLHHNALPDGRDPLEHEGLSTFYYHPASLHLARNLQLELPVALNRPSYGLFYDNLALTRIARCPSVLVELGFFTHPDEFAQIRSDAFQSRAANALVQSIVRYLESL